MQIDGYEISVSVDRSVEADGEVLLDIEQSGHQWIVVALSREQAMSLGGLLIGVATDVNGAARGNS